MRYLLFKVVFWTGICIVLGALLIGGFARRALAQDTEKTVAISPDVAKMVYLTIAICITASCLGAAYAVAKVGSAAMGAVAEKPELMGRSLIFVGLAEGIAIYGLLIAVLLLGKV
jgi:V/A-type H+-transporting ATPase subunit K